MTTESLGDFVFIITVSTLGTIPSWYNGRESGRIELQDELVSTGHAEYYLDENNKRQWRMK